MNKISNYTELVAERKILETRIVEQKKVINNGINELKVKLEPFMYLLPVLNVFKSGRSGGSFLKFVASAGIDLLVGQKLLTKANWLVRLIVPMLLKSVTKKAIEEGNEKGDIIPAINK
jgi:hypothetical protein